MGTSAWDYITPQKPQTTDPWESISPTFKAEEDDWKERIINRTRNIGNIIGAGISVATGTTTPNQQRVLDVLKAGQEVAGGAGSRIGYSLTHPFENSNDVRETFRQLTSSAVEGVQHPIDSMVGLAKMMTVDLVSSMVGDTFRAVSGVNISGKDIKPLEPEEYDASAKMMIGNAVGVLAAPGISKMVGAGFASRVPYTGAKTMEGMVEQGMKAEIAQQSIGQAGRYVPTIGVLGRAVISDVSATVGGGALQGSIANAGTPEALSGFVTGMLFAPLGVVSGWYRGVKMKGMGNVETIVTDAHDASMKINARHIEAASAGQEVAAIRAWQNSSDLTPAHLAQKVENVLSSDTIEEAIGKSPVSTTEPANIGTLYDDFKTRLDKDQNKSFDVHVAEYILEKGLGEHTSQIRYNFAKRFVDAGPEAEVAHMKSVLDRAFKIKEEFGSNDIVQVASERGFFITDEHGALKIRDVDTGEKIYTAHSTAEALEFMRNSGEPANAIPHDAGTPLTTLGIKIPLAPAAHQHMAADWHPVENDPSMTVKPTQRMAALDLGRLEKVTATAPYFKGLDTIFDTDFTSKLVEPVAKLQRDYQHEVKSTITNDPLIRDIDRLVKEWPDTYTGNPLNLKDRIAGKSKRISETLEWVSKLRETQTIEEMMTPNGYHKNFTLSPVALETAQFAHEKSVDLNNVQVYRRSKFNIRQNAVNRARARATEMFGKDAEMVETVGVDKGAVFDNYQLELGNFTDETFVAEMKQLGERFKPDADFLEAEKQLDSFNNVANAATNISGAIRLKLSLDNPREMGLSRVDFIKEHKLSKRQIELAEKLDVLYDKYAEKFGISDSKMFVRYMNHYRQYGDILDTVLADDFTRGIDEAQMRKFASSMIRTGEVLNFTSNPIDAFHAYLRGGLKSHLYEQVHLLFNEKDSHGQANLNKITGKMKEVAAQRMNQLQNDVVGQATYDAKVVKEVQAHMFDNMGVTENGRKLTREEMIGRLQKADPMDIFMNLSSSSLLGLRMSLALRDAADTWQKYNIRHGPARLWDMAMTKVTNETIREHVELGFITDPDPADVLNVTHSLEKGGRYAQAARELAKFGYQGSLQPLVYMKNQTKVFISTSRHVLREIEKLSGDKIDRATLDENINLRMYDKSTQRQFNAYLADGKTLAAARELATQDVRELVGTFARGNQAPVLNSSVGKLFGQLGSWGMTNRSVLQDLLTRGTREDIRRSHIRYATSIGAMMVTGQATGLNLGRWLMLPTSLVATGGPLLQSFQSAGGAAAATLGDNEASQQFANRDFKRSAWQLVPYAYAVQDVAKAAELQSGGSGYGVGRTAAQAVGIGVNKNRRTMLDWFMGNYPVEP